MDKFHLVKVVVWRTELTQMWVNLRVWQTSGMCARWTLILTFKSVHFFLAYHIWYITYTQCSVKSCAFVGYFLPKRSISSFFIGNGPEMTILIHFRRVIRPYWTYTTCLRHDVSHGIWKLIFLILIVMVINCQKKSTIE